MIPFDQFTLSNGLRVVISCQKNLPLSYVSVLYSAGSKFEQPGRTGLAHLMEHLMFSGTRDVPDFDHILQLAGGENNAFTNSDYSQYIDIVPSENLAVALFLEADRMRGVVLSQDKVVREKKVVIEEFYETCLDLPYGDVWHDLYPMAFRNSPYAWPTIGSSIEDLSGISRGDVLEFYHRYFQPSNAVLSIVSPLPVSETRKMVEHYYAGIPAQQNASEEDSFPDMDLKRKGAKRRIQREVPHNALYLAFPVGPRFSADYIRAELGVQLLNGGRSARFYQQLLQDTDDFIDVDAYLTGTLESGLMIVEALLDQNTTFQAARELILKEIRASEEFRAEEIDRVLKTTQSHILFSETVPFNTCLNLAFFEYGSSADRINREYELFQGVRSGELRDFIRDRLQLESAFILEVEKRSQSKL